MTAEGTWTLTINTPVGKQHPVLEITSTDGTLTGISRDPADNSETPLNDLALDGTKLTWSQQVTKPMRMKAKFTITVTGDTMDGTVKAGMMPTAKVTAERNT